MRREKCTAVFCLNHFPFGPFFCWALLWGSFPQGTEKCSFLPSPARFLWWKNCEARNVYRRKQNQRERRKKRKEKNNVEKWAPQLVFTKQLMLLAVGKKCSGPKPISRPPQPLYAAERRGFLTVSKKNIFKCVWLLNVNLHKRWMSSMVLHQQNAPLFQYAKWRLSPSRMSSGISKPQTEFSFSGFEKFELALGENFTFMVEPRTKETVTMKTTCCVDSSSYLLVLKWFRKASSLKRTPTTCDWCCWPTCHLTVKVLSFYWQNESEHWRKGVLTRPA